MTRRARSARRRPLLWLGLCASLLAGCEANRASVRNGLVAEISGGEFLSTDGVTLQAQEADCGPAVLHMLLRDAGVAVRYDSVLAFHTDPRDFWSFTDLRRHAATFGVHLEGFRANLPGLEHARLPLIAHFQDHFVLVDSLFADRVHVRDPYVGRLQCTPATFRELWTSNVLAMVSDTSVTGTR